MLAQKDSNFFNSTPKTSNFWREVRTEKLSFPKVVRNIEREVVPFTCSLFLAETQKPAAKFQSIEGKIVL